MRLIIVFFSLGIFSCQRSDHLELGKADALFYFEDLTKDEQRIVDAFFQRQTNPGERLQIKIARFSSDFTFLMHLRGNEDERRAKVDKVSERFGNLEVESGFELVTKWEPIDK